VVHHFDLASNKITAGIMHDVAEVGRRQSSVWEIWA
jgi:hypothetical protein